MAESETILILTSPVAHQIHSGHDMLGVSRSRVFRENPEGIGFCIWLASLNLVVKMEAGTMRKYEVENCTIYLKLIEQVTQLENGRPMTPLTQQSVKVKSYAMKQRTWEVLLFENGIVFHCMHVSYFLYSFISQWTFGLFPHLD